VGERGLVKKRKEGKGGERLHEGKNVKKSHLVRRGTATKHQRAKKGGYKEETGRAAVKGQ